MSRQTWRTRNGETLFVDEMETSHINNCIRMLERTIASRPDEYAYGEPDGSMALEAFRSEIRRNDIFEQEMRWQIDTFKKELGSRNE